MKMKKIAAMVLAAAMLAGMTACSDTDAEQVMNVISETNKSDSNDEDKSILGGIFGSDNSDEKTEEADLPVEEKLVNEGLENSLYRYDEYDNHIEIVEYLLDAPAVEIPSEIDGKPVTVIKKYAFSDKSLSTLIVPDTITYIESGAFRRTPWLEAQEQPVIVNNILIDYSSASGDVVIPDGVTKIGECAFESNVEITSVVIPEGVMEIGAGAFASCSALEMVDIPNTVTSIEYMAFSECSSLTSVNIPDTVTAIGSGAFYYCSSLMSISIPSGVTSICGGSFRDCKSLTSIIISDGVKIIEEKAFRGCTSITSINIPNSVTTIEKEAFCNCSNLTSVIIPDSVTSIGGYAFAGCSSLVDISVPDSVVTIGEFVFTETPWLEAQKQPVILNNILIDYSSANGNVIIPDSIIAIAGGTFCDCSSLTGVTIPNSVTVVGDNAFEFCESLTNVTIPNSVTEIGDYAFAHCESLTSITITDSVTTIGYMAFAGCPNLTDITIPDRFKDRYDEIFG